jgi:hypothetical protein
MNTKINCCYSINWSFVCKLQNTEEAPKETAKIETAAKSKK